MKKSFLVLGMIALGFSILFSSCKKDETTPEEENTNPTIKTGEVTLSKTELYKDDWVYFSFETGAEVSGLDSLNYKSNTNWDIAFHSRLGRTNSGMSTENGLGGIYESGTDFSAVEVVVENSLTTDSIVKLISGINYISGPIYKDVTGNFTFDGAIDADNSHPPIYTVNNKVYVIKTANGKYAKIQITSFADDQGESGHIVFKYAYQTDGSLKLK